MNDNALGAGLDRRDGQTLQKAMEMIIGFLAICVAFCALWLASQAMKKAEDQFTELASAIREELAKTRAEADAKVATVSKRLQSLERRVEEARQMDGNTTQMLDAIRIELRTIKDDLAATQTALPPQVRARVKSAEHRASN